MAWKDREDFKKWADAIYAMVEPGEPVPDFVMQIPAEPLPLNEAEKVWAEASARRWLDARPA